MQRVASNRNRRTAVGGFDDIGFPGLMRPLGYSYSLGQAALHYPIPSNPQDAGLPADDWLLEFASAWSGDPFHPLPSTSLDVLKRTQSFRDAWAAFKRNGTLPTDSEVIAPTADESQGWTSADNILRQRFVYFFDSQDNYGRSAAHGVATGLDSTSAMYVQIQGYSASTHTWVLPRVKGQQAMGWRYAGTSPLVHGGAAQWTYAYSFGQWGADNAVAIAQAVLAVAGAALAAFTAGASLGLAGVVVSAMTSMLKQASACAVSGKSVDFFPVLLAAGQAVLKEEGPDLRKAIARMPDMGQAITALTSATAKVEKAIGNVDTYLDANVGKLINGDFGTWLRTATATATKESLTAQWPAAIQMVGGGGGLDQDGQVIAPIASVGRFFVEQTQHAIDHAELQSIFDAAPWYAKGSVHLGAVTRAIEFGAAVDARQLVTKPHLLSARYMASARYAERAPGTASPVLTRVTPPPPPRSLATQPSASAGSSSGGVLAALALAIILMMKK